MKRMLAAGSIAALATVVFAGTANADPAGGKCFGQTHKAVNAGALAGSGIDNVGDLVNIYGGQGKKAIASSPPYCP
jgi:hypothetical protein